MRRDDPDSYRGQQPIIVVIALYNRFLRNTMKA
jgi:hypothetical protein